MSLVCHNDVAMLRIAHGHVVVVFCIGCSAANIKDAGEHLRNCNSIDKTGPQLMVVSCIFGFFGGIGNADDHCLHVRGLSLCG